MKEPVRKHEIHEIIMKIAVHKLLNSEHFNQIAALTDEETCIHIHLHVN